jgi:hypothetical protein
MELTSPVQCLSSQLQQGCSNLSLWSDSGKGAQRSVRIVCSQSLGPPDQLGGRSALREQQQAVNTQCGVVGPSFVDSEQTLLEQIAG